MGDKKVDYKQKVRDRLKERILVLDGAMGTMIQKIGLPDSSFMGKRGNNDLLNITVPDIIESIHKEYIKAGADIITTNTFSGTAVSQADYDCTNLVYEINRKGASIARKAAEKKDVLVAGSMGPTLKMLSFSPDVNNPEYRSIDFDTMSEAYAEQARGLLDGGIDLFLIETVIDGLNTKAALYAIETECERRGIKMPVIVSATINDKSGRLLNGQQLESLYTAISHYDLAAFGLNCSFGAKDLLPFVEQISNELFLGRGVDCPVILYPNAGLPNEMGEYDESPEYMAECIREVAAKGLVNIVGGCCGTTPEHIAAIRNAVEGIAPRQIRDKKEDRLWVSGLESLLIEKEVNNFVNIGERTNVAGSAKFAKMIREGDYAHAAEVARNQIDGGATVIDINMDDGMLDGPSQMTGFVRYAGNDPDIAKVPFMIDSSHWETIIAGLKNCAGKCFVNSLSLKEGEREFEEKAKEVYKLGAALIVMAFDENGQAVTYERKIEICRRAYDILTRIGYSPQEIIFDVNVLSVATGIEEHDNYAVDFIRAVKWIKENLQGCKTSGGISNLSFAFRGNNKVREAMHSVFLYHAISAGLDMAIVNPSMLQIYDQIDPLLLSRVEAVILNDRTLLGKDAEKYATPTDALIELAQEIKAEETGYKDKAADERHGNLRSGKNLEWRDYPLDGKLSYALVKGVSEYIPEDMEEALTIYPNPMDIIQGPLMDAMDKVGNLFGEGKMFLPQVVKSAKVMRDAVNYLTPHIQNLSENKGSANNGTIVLATVKGDVHDIGKNILSIVLSCNNFNVIDLGVMVSNETILEEAIRHKADIIGASGLITPSLEQMENLCRLVEQQKERVMDEVGHPIVICVGGATTSSVHTAVKLAPLYSYCVAYSVDASKAVGLCKKIMKEANFAEKLKEEQLKIREAYNSRDAGRLAIESARAMARKFPLESFIQKDGYGEYNINARYSVNDLVPLIEWTPFFNFWGFKGKYPSLLYDERTSKEAEDLFIQANDALACAAKDGSIEIKAVVCFYDAYSENETLSILENREVEPNVENRLNLVDGRRTIARLKFPRQSQTNSRHLCVADYFPEAPYTSRAGFMVIKVEDLEAPGMDHKDFNYLLRQSLCARLAEAAAKHITEHISAGEKVVRAAVGYDMIPDHAYKKNFFDLTNAEKSIGVSLTPNFAIIPTTSICAMLIAHKEAEFFDIQ